MSCWMGCWDDITNVMTGIIPENSRIVKRTSKSWQFKLQPLAQPLGIPHRDLFIGEILQVPAL